jgi:acyl transferase domain-containing protein
VDTVLKVASRLFERGCPVNIQAINQPIHPECPPILVSLPNYPWNHSTRYWAEPRVHINYRLRRWPRHDLLGVSVKFSNALEPRWRNWIRLSELPWLRDHRVQSLVRLAFIFPFVHRQLCGQLLTPMCDIGSLPSSRLHLHGYRSCTSTCYRNEHTN